MSGQNNFADKLKVLNDRVGKFFSDVKNDQKTRTLAIIVGAVAVLGIVLLVLLLTNPKTNVEPGDASSEATIYNDAAINLVNKTEADVLEMNYTNSDCSVTLYKDEKGVMHAREFEDIPLKDDYLKYSWEYSYYFGADQKVDVTPGADISAFGFEQPSAVLTTKYRDGSVNKITVGGVVPGQYDQSYIRFNDDPTIYVTTVHKSVYNKKPDFATTTIQATPKNGNSYKNITIDNVTLSGCGLAAPVKFNVNKDAQNSASDTFAFSYVITMHDGMVYGADDSYAKDLFYQLTDITANKVMEIHPSPEKLAEYGLANPKGSVSYTYQVEDGTPETRKILIGGPEEQFTYIMYEGRNAVFRIENAQFTKVLSPVLADMRSEYIFTRAFSNIKALTVAYDGESYRFELNRSENADGDKSFYNYSAVHNGKEINLSLYQKYFMTLVSMSAASYDAQAKADAEPALTMKFEYFDEVGKDAETFTFTETNKVRQYLCRINGKGDASVSEAVINRIKSNTKNLINGKPIVEF